MVCKRNTVHTILRIRYAALLLAAFALVLATFSPASARAAFPEVIPLPDGFQPEGIATGYGHTFYAGSIPTGAIFMGDYRTGEGELLVPAQSGRSAIGLDFDERSGFLFVSGGMTGQAYVYNGETGETEAVYQLATPPGVFINDVIVTREAAYFTNSFQPYFYRVPLGPGGALPDPSEIETIPLTGDFVMSGGFNANGITATPNGEWLIIVQSSTGSLFRVDPDSGYAEEIELSGLVDAVPAGDGILLIGHTLYVVQNQLNQIAEVELSADYTSGVVVDILTDPDFRVPTTIARFGEYLYAVNARFGTPPTPDTEYEVVQVRR